MPLVAEVNTAGHPCTSPTLDHLRLLRVPDQVLGPEPRLLPRRQRQRPGDDTGLAREPPSPWQQAQPASADTVKSPNAAAAARSWPTRLAANPAQQWSGRTQQQTAGSGACLWTTPSPNQRKNESGRQSRPRSRSNSVIVACSVSRASSRRCAQEDNSVCPNLDGVLATKRPPLSLAMNRAHSSSAA